MLICLAWLVSCFFDANAQDNSAAFRAIVSDAEAARESGDVSRAIALYSQAVQLDPKWPDGWWFLGSLQYGADSYAEARDALNHYIGLMPNAAPAVALRGLCEFETGEYMRSLIDLERGIALGAANQPRNEKILREHEAQLLTRMGKFEQALDSYTILARSSPTDEPQVLAGIGLAGLRVPQLPRDLLPDQRDLYVTAGSAALRFMAGDSPGAQFGFQYLFQRYPAAVNAHYLYGYLLFAREPDQGIAEFKKEIEIDPNNGAAQAMLAWASLLKNDPAEALPYAKAAAANGPYLPMAQLVLGRSLFETGDAGSGIAHLETAQQLEPENLEVHIALAKAYSKTGRKEDAMRERQQSLQLTSNEATRLAQP